MIYIENTENIFFEKDANKFIKNHVVISKKDLKRIKSLAKKHGFLEALKALDIKVFPLTPTRKARK